MNARQTRQLVQYLLTFVAVFVGMWLILELIGFFFVDVWQQLIRTWHRGEGYFILIAIAGIVTYISYRYARRLGLDEFPDARLSFDLRSPQHTRNRENVIANVRHAYVEGVLHQSMHKQARLNLEIHDRPEALNRRPVHWEGQPRPQSIFTSDEIYQLFIEGGRRLLILGAPGSGKTITLLELCDDLLQNAAMDLHAPVPVVFNLSSWAEYQKPLDNWLVDEMDRQYGLAKTVTPNWLAHEQLCLLLDGLDEVRADLLDKCVRAINDFGANYGAPMVVCSRISEYDTLSERLNLSRALYIQPLDYARVQAYLSDPKLQLDAVLDAVQQDGALAELATNPLTLNIMAAAYEGATQGELGPIGEDEEFSISSLYNLYIRREFLRRPSQVDSYSITQALLWLRYLAHKMVQRSETQFTVEEIDLEWLSPTQRRRARLPLYAFLGVLVGGLGGALNSAELTIATAIVFGAAIGVVSYFGEALIQHYTLRLALAYYGHLPLRLRAFLDGFESGQGGQFRLIRFRQSLGCYEFSDRSILEHFAELTDKDIDQITSFNQPGSASNLNRCTARSRYGEQCTRYAQPNSSFCWQHVPTASAIFRALKVASYGAIILGSLGLAAGSLLVWIPRYAPWAPQLRLDEANQVNSNLDKLAVLPRQVAPEVVWLRRKVVPEAEYPELLRAGDELLVRLSLTSQAPWNWLRFERKALVRIDGYHNIDSYVHVIQPCVDNSRALTSTISVHVADKDLYVGSLIESATTNPDYADEFKVYSDEREVFEVSIKLDQPGNYLLSVGVPYSERDNDHVLWTAESVMVTLPSAYRSFGWVCDDYFGLGEHPVLVVEDCVFDYQRHEYSCEESSVTGIESTSGVLRPVVEDTVQKYALTKGEGGNEYLVEPSSLRYPCSYLATNAKDFAPGSAFELSELGDTLTSRGALNEVDFRIAFSIEGLHGAGLEGWAYRQSEFEANCVPAASR